MIEVGEYVKTHKGDIHKVIGIREEVKEGKRIYSHKAYYLDSKKGSLTEAFIIKHSKNIIDLIEEGDYVNGVEVQYVYGYDEDGNDLDGLGICEVDGDYAYYKYLEDITIHSIITKEQFASTEYKVKE